VLLFYSLLLILLGLLLFGFFRRVVGVLFFLFDLI